jgi:tetratricopeptide (TPR) repeat protein
MSIEQVQSVLECNASDLDDALRDMLQVFLVIADKKISLASKHVWLFAKAHLSRALVESSFNAAVAGLGQTIGWQSPREGSAVVLQPTTPALVAIPTSVMSPLQVLSVAQDELRRGASGAALQRLDAWRQWSQASITPPIEASLLRLEADALGQLGEYDAAIGKLKLVFGLPDSDPEVSIELGEKQLRAGRYSEALLTFKRARRLARERQLPGLWVTAVARTLTVRNETRSHPPSSLLASLLVKVCDQSLAHISPKDLCLGLRISARSLALAHGTAVLSEELARRALLVATDQTRSKRDEGNCYYALGDVLRHARSHVAARAAFGSAYEIARETENYDLRLYALLGMAANAIACLEVASLGSLVSNLDVVCSAEQSDEYRIIQLFKLVYNNLSFGDLRIGDARAVAGRPWTSSLLALANESASSRSAIAEALIVL